MTFLKTILFCSILALISCDKSPNVKQDTEAIKAMMHQQAKDWSAGHLEKFMSGYWQSDELKFIGSKGLTYGWQQTLDNYKKSYPSKDYTGTLKFDIMEISPLEQQHYHVIGSYHLKRSVGDANGIFSLILKKIDGEWKIIIDHSS